jgi:hypothetical protein
MYSRTNVKTLNGIIAAMAAVVLITIAVINCSTQTRENKPGPVNITYYSDARGVFTLTPPTDTAGYKLPLWGTCSLPEIMLQASKKGPRLPARHATFRTNGKAGFSIIYLLKDGAGDYDIFIFGKKSLATRNLDGLCSFTIRSTKEMPADNRVLNINEKILAYVDTVIGKTVGSGECWDLAQEALDINGADWVRPYSFGRPLDPGRERIIPGDIIQFKSVRLLQKLPGGGSMSQNIGTPDHTAVIIGVEGENRYELAHQNSNGKRYVITSTVDLNYIKSGKYWLYRPVAGIVK